MMREGVNRPGAMERKVGGLTTKALNERLRKLMRFGILHKEIFPEVQPRVEYQLTAYGEKFIGVSDKIESLEREIIESEQPLQKKPLPFDVFSRLGKN